MNESRSARLAVLIDADNASAKIADGLFEEIAKIGEASVRRIYGDFSTPRMKGWTDILARHAIIPHQQFAYTTGKNASDITLVIDAMDLLHSGRFDGFCLVSSDSDFTRLASRIREQGVNVYGFGEQKTPESFRQACRRFIYTENLLPERIAPSRDSVETTAPPLRQKSDALPMLTRVIEQMESEDSWVNLGTFGKQLQNLYTDFDPRTYGERKLSDLVRRTNAFEVKHPEGGSLLIRLKQGGRPATPASSTAAPSPAPSAGPTKAAAPAVPSPAPATTPTPPAAPLPEALAQVTMLQTPIPLPPVVEDEAPAARPASKASRSDAAPARRASTARQPATAKSAAGGRRGTRSRAEPTASEPAADRPVASAAASPPEAPAGASEPAPAAKQASTPKPAPTAKTSATPAPGAPAAAAPAAGDTTEAPKRPRTRRPLGTPRA